MIYVDLLAPGSKFYLRANPGIPHKAGPYVDIFPWTFEIVNEFAERYGLKLLEFKREPAELGRLFFVYQKLWSYNLQLPDVPAPMDAR